MKEELKEKKINIIDVYDYLEKCGIICKHAFYGDEILEKEDFLEGEEV